MKNLADLADMCPTMHTVQCGDNNLITIFSFVGGGHSGGGGGGLFNGLLMCKNRHIVADAYLVSSELHFVRSQKYIYCPDKVKFFVSFISHSFTKNINIKL